MKKEKLVMIQPNIHKVGNGIFILPSNPEPIGLVVLEAMYNNLPILCSSRAGASSYVISKKNGLMFNPNNYMELAKKFYFTPIQT